MAASLEAKLEFKQLCDVFENITRARAPKKKTQLLQTFIDSCRSIGDKLKTERPESSVSLYPIVRLILPGHERERGPYNLKQQSLARLYAEVCGFAKTSDNYKTLVKYREPATRARASGEAAGSDFADRAYLVLAKRLPRTCDGFTIERANAFLDRVSGENATRRAKVEAFRELFRQVTGLEAKWITRIVLKDLRLGIGTQRILEIYHQDANEAFLVTKDLREICDRFRDPRARPKCGIRVFSHFSPMLLERCDIGNSDKLFGNKNDAYHVQPKYDGERLQLHMRDGRYMYLTRRGFDITKNPGYGETGSSGFLTSVFSRRLNPNCHSFILDGEIMGWHKENRRFGTKGMNFDVKKLTERSHYQPCFVVFDIVLHNGVLLDDVPYQNRFRLLNDVFTEEEGSLIICRSTLISSREELIEAFNKCLDDNEEGLAVKRCNMKYKPGVRDGGGGYKIKAEYSDNLVQDLDLIVLGGYYGDGKYAGMIKSFMTGVAASAGHEERPARFLAVVSVSTGIGDEALRELQTKFAPHWVKERPENITGPKSCQPDLWIRPEHSMILTVRATEMVRSTEYPTGYSLRFPRVTSVRGDKPWHDSCTQSELLSLVKDKGVIQKLTKRKVIPDDIGEAPIPKSRKPAGRSATSYERIAYKKRVTPHTRLLDGKEICVVNGTDELAKEEIEDALRQHSAKIVQNPLNTTFCVIVGNSKTIRAKEVINSGKHDVVSLDWFNRVTNQSDYASPVDFLPWELLCRQDTTNQRLEHAYDEYYDSFTVDADEESLKRSFDKVAESSALSAIAAEEERKLDEELFDGDASPYSLFRDAIGFFEDPTCRARYKFRFMSGRVKEEFDGTVTHVFTHDEAAGNGCRAKTLRTSARASATIVKCEWIERCFRSGRVCEVTDYLVRPVIDA